MGLGRVGVGSGRMGLGELHWDWGEWGELELLGATWSGVVDWTGVGLGRLEIGLTCVGRVGGPTWGGIVVGWDGIWATWDGIVDVEWDWVGWDGFGASWNGFRENGIGRVSLGLG